MSRTAASIALYCSLLFSIGCYSTVVVTKEEFILKGERADVTLISKDSIEYKFLEGNYRLQGDTLKGFGVRRRQMFSDIVLDASLPLADISSIEAEEFNSTKTLLLGGGVGIGALIITKILFFNNTSDSTVGSTSAGPP